jgi:hypothetical protein
MVTSGQITRGVFRSMRAMDRASKQAQRQRIAQQKALHHNAMLDASAMAAAEYEEIVAALTRAHRIQFKRRDWLTLATSPIKPMPERHHGNEETARRRLDDYQPGFFARLFRREEGDRQQLSAKVVTARSKDDADHAGRVTATNKHNAEIKFAQKVVELVPDALIEALDRHSALGALPFSIEGIDTIFIGNRVVAVVDGLDFEDMPEESISLLKSGKASVKLLPSTRRYEMHKEAICSAAVRVALEFLGSLPIGEVEVLMLTDVLDRSSGHIESSPVLHVRMTEQSARTLNFERADPSALIDRLGGHLEWNKKDGFRKLNPLTFGIELEK